MKKQIILLSFSKGRGSCASEAYMFGPLGVHRGCSRSGETLDGWTVTHVRTGCVVVKRLSFNDACWVARQARGFAWEWGEFGVQSAHEGRNGDEWSTLEALKTLLREKGL